MNESEGGPSIHHPFRAIRDDGIHTRLEHGVYIGYTLATVQTTTLSNMKKALGQLKQYGLCGNIKDELDINVSVHPVYSNRSEPTTF